LTALSAAGAPLSAAGAAFTVDSTTDAVDANPGDGACASAAGDCTLRAAIQETNALAGADAITLPAGTYTLTIAGANEDAAATGDLDITDDLTLTGAGRDVTVIDANQLDRVMHTVPPASESMAVIAAQISIHSGHATGHYGGAVLNGDKVTLTLQFVSVTQSLAGFDGGGIFNQGPNGELRVSDAEVSRNEGALAAESVGGGGIGNAGTAVLVRTTVADNRAGSSGGGIHSAGVLDLSDSLIERNQASAFGGGGIWAGGTAAVERTLLRGNHAHRGGGIETVGFMSLRDTIFDRNRAQPMDGGGLLNLGSLVVSRAAFAANTSAAAGGGLRNGTTAEIRSANAVITESSFEGNGSAMGGGGIANGGQGQAETVLSLNAVTLHANSSSFGGGIANFGNDVIPGIWGTVDVTNSTISGNQATSAGGGISNGGGFSVTNATIAFNTAPADQAIENGPFSGIQFLNTIVQSIGPVNNCTAFGVTSLGHNLSSDGTCGLNAAGDLPNTDALLEPLDDNGGFTQTHALAIGSPAVDAGDAAACPSTDQRGAPRPFDGDIDGSAVCDIGAYEAGSTPPATPTPTPGPTNTPSPPLAMATPTSTPGSLPRTGERPEPGGRSTASPAVWGALCAAAGALTIPILAHRRASRRRGGKP
jgi:CSLREA domain-containing protein